jgi:hypothetical protein
MRIQPALTGSDPMHFKAPVRRLSARSQTGAQKGRRWRFGYLLFAGLLVAPALASIAGCATAEKEPLTVTEWLRQPRVGDALR